MKTVTIYLSLGSNLGDRKENLRKALRLFNEEATLVAVSSVYETEPLGYVDQPLFLNIVCMLETSLSPWALLDLCQNIELRLDRVPNFRHGPRTMDVDILFYSECVMNMPRLQIPHPRMAQRAFVIMPLLEIAPNLVHPTLQRSFVDLLTDTDDKEKVVLRWPPSTITTSAGAL